ALTPSVTASNKIYDGTTAGTTTCTLTGAIGADVVTCAGTAAFDTALVGTGKTVTVTGIALSGAAAGNYTLASTTATTTANITAVALTPTVTAANKIYNGTTAAISTCALAGIVGSDAVSCAGTATFDTALVGTGKPVTVSGIVLSGGAAGNYTLASTTATTTANITAVALTPTVTAANKTYDGTTAAITTCALIGVVGSDVVTCAGTATFDTAFVGTGKTVTVSGIALSGAAAGNYTLANTTATTTANITAVGLTPTVTAANKIYDGTTAATS